MKLRTADLLYSGKIIRELCAECVPEIVKPEKLVTKDVDALFAFLRLVTYGPKMQVSSIHDCDNAAIHQYEVDLESVLQDPNNGVLEHADVLYRIPLSNGQIVHAKPPEYEEAMRVMLMKHDIARLEAKNEQPTDEQVKQIFLADMIAVIESVEIPNELGGEPIIVTNQAQISEWLTAISKPVLNEIYEGVHKTDVWGFPFKLKLTCKDCGAVYEHNLELDPVSFFYG